MKLYIVNGSPNVRKVVAVVHHLGSPVELVQLDFAAGDLHRPEYLAVNPNAMVPALKDGDLKLWESNAIMQYLASQRPSELFPQDLRARADISRWQFWETNHLNRALSSLVFERFFKQMFKMGEVDEGAVQKAIKDFDRFAPVLESQLAHGSYVVGKHPTLADFSIGGHFTYAQPAGLPLEKYPRIREWYAMLEQLPAWKASAPKMGGNA